MWTSLSIALAADLAVGPTQPYPTLADAFDDAVDGDRILVDPGVYVEDTLDAGGRQLTVVATPGTATVVAGRGRHVFVVGAGGSLRIEGLDVDGADDAGIAEVTGGALTLVFVTASQARAAVPGLPGGSIEATDAVVVLEDSVFDGAVAPVKDGGHVYALRSSIVSTRSTFRGGEAAAGGGVALREGSSLLVTGGSFEANIADEGAAIDADDSVVAVDGASFVGHTAVDGVVRCVAGSTCSLVGARFDGNTAPTGGVLVLSASVGELRAALVCRAAGGDAIVAGPGSSLVVANTALTAVTSTSSLLTVDAAATAALTNNTWALAETPAPAIDAAGALTLTNNLFVALGPAAAVAASGDLFGGFNLYADVPGGPLVPLLPTDVVGVDPRIGVPLPDSCLTDPLRPRAGSPLVDGGDPALLDADGSRSDIGAFGGDGNPAVDGLDADGDGFSTPADCDDASAAVSPAIVEQLCNGIDDDCDPATLDDADADGDGVSACTGDCDDADPAVRPGAVEVVCNGVDDDCDAASADGPDADGDGVDVCTDCDDADPNISPAAAEVTCNGADDDCDPSTLDDEDTDADGVSVCDGDCNDTNPNAGIPVAVYFDGDGDGFGVGAPTTFCVPPNNASPADGDCDDVDPTVFPGAVDVPYDGVDQDCDGVDLDDLDGDGSLFGDDCDDADPRRFPGADDVPDDGIDQDCTGSDVAATLVGGAGVTCGCGTASGPAGGVAIGVVWVAARRRRR